MASFILHLQFNHKPYTCILQSNVSLNGIKRRVGRLIGIISADIFEIQIYDERSKGCFVLDDEFVENLNERLPRVYNSTLFGDILLNHSSMDYRAHNRCDNEAKLNDSEFGSLSEWNSIDNDNRAPEEVSMFQHQDNEPACFEKLLATTSNEEQINVCSSQELEYLTNISEPMTYVNQSNSLPSNDEIKRNICHPDTSFRSDETQLLIIERTNPQAQTLVQKVKDTVVKPPISTRTNPVESLCANWDRQHSDHSLSHLPDQIAQQTPSVPLSSSLQFAHDVHPYQKTQHNTDNSNKYSDKNVAPFITRIQGIKTDADKGKSILPRLKLSSAHISSCQLQKPSLYLVVAAVREEKVNGKRLFYTCIDMQFLPGDTTKETDAVNPIRLSLHSLPRESDGTFNLPLRLMNNPTQSMIGQAKNRLFHELDENIATSLHSTPYDSRFFRLVCTLEIDNNITWDTLCLSDYIRPKQRLETRSCHQSTS